MEQLSATKLETYCRKRRENTFYIAVWQLCDYAFAVVLTVCKVEYYCYEKGSLDVLVKYLLATKTVDRQGKVCPYSPVLYPN